MISFISNFYFIIKGCMDLVSGFMLFKCAVRGLAGVHKSLHLNVRLVYTSNKSEHLESQGLW